MPKISQRKVSPTGPLGAKILVIGEAPGYDEDKEGIPFVGRSGELLWDTFRRYGIFREQVRVTNLSCYRPDNNIFAILEGSPQLVEGINEIKDYVMKYPPNVIVLVGDKPLSYLTGRHGIYAHRSSILQYIYDDTIKCVPILHPAGIYQTPESYLLFDFDVKRAIEESASPQFNYTKREYILVGDFLSPDQYEEIYNSSVVSVDIESTVDRSSDVTQIVPIVVGFGVSPNKSFVVDWTPHTFPQIKDLLENNNTKIFHFGYCSDVEILKLYGIEVGGYIHDTYYMQQTLDPTLPRSLSFLTTTYTREPYYKKTGRASIPEDTKVWSNRQDKSELRIYNGKDCCVTFEVYEKLLDILSNEGLLKKYKFKISCAQKAQIITRNGLLLDQERRDLFKKALVYKWTRLQQVLNMMANRIVNVNSSQGKTSIQHLLYEELKLPVRRNRVGKPRADEKALLSLVAHCQGEVDSKKTESLKAQWTIKREICKTIIEIRQLRKLISSYIDVGVSSDGRIRSVFNAGGTETNRWSAYKYVDGTGLNAMTFPRGEVIIPDDLPKDDINTKEIIEQLRKEMEIIVEEEDENE